MINQRILSRLVNTSILIQPVTHHHAQRDVEYKSWHYRVGKLMMLTLPTCWQKTIRTLRLSGITFHPERRRTLKYHHSKMTGSHTVALNRKQTSCTTSFKLFYQGKRNSYSSTATKPDQSYPSLNEMCTETIKRPQTTQSCWARQCAYSTHWTNLIRTDH